MVSICPVCRKEFEILHPPLWRYKINNTEIKDQVREDLLLQLEVRAGGRKAE